MAADLSLQPALQKLNPVVCDASALGEYLLRTDLGHPVGTIVEAPESRLSVPANCDVEMCSALGRMVAAGDLAGARAAAALSTYLDLPLTRHGHMGLIPRIAELATGGLSAGHAAYLALSESLGATLVTCDRHLTRAARERSPVNVVGVS